MGVLLVITVLVGGAAYGAGAFESIAFDSQSANVGAVREGQDVRLRFSFRNSGRSSATIVSVDPACGIETSIMRGRATAPDEDGDTEATIRPGLIISPGETGEIEARIRTAGHQGPLDRSILVTVKDPLERTIFLEINGNVEREFVADSTIVDFGAVAHDASLRREVRVRLDNTSHRVLAARSTDDYFDAHVESEQNAKFATVVVSTRGRGPSGLKFGTIRISTSSPHLRELTVPVRAVVADLPK